MTFKVTLTSDPKLPFRVCVPKAHTSLKCCKEHGKEPQHISWALVLTHTISLTFDHLDPCCCRFSVPEAAPFTAVLKFAAEEV